MELIVFMAYVFAFQEQMAYSASTNYLYLSTKEKQKQTPFRMIDLYITF